MKKQASASVRQASRSSSSSAFAEVRTVDADEFRRAAVKIRKNIKSKAAALKVLVDAGIYTTSGNLRSHYKK
ncbi:MAG: hypothetical protein NUV50_12845 [Rhodospirillales bacterium]|nr:hypothetical protein [Rhodospirillales bacterium]